MQLVLQYLECYEHTSDDLEQQRLIQIIVDEMAKRPRLNLMANHFRDSYLAEVACLKQKRELIGQVVSMLIQTEFKENNTIREYLEKTYKLLHEQMENKWSYNMPEKLDAELNKRELIQTGTAGTRDPKVDMHMDSDGELNDKDQDEIQEFQEQVQDEAQTIFVTKFSDPKEFANFLGIPFSSLQMLMKQHHERDHLISTAIHEHVSFIKIQEGYPQFIYKTDKVQN